MSLLRVVELETPMTRVRIEVESTRTTLTDAASKRAVESVVETLALANEDMLRSIGYEAPVDSLANIDQMSAGAALCAAMSVAWDDRDDASVFWHRARAVMEHLGQLGWVIVRFNEVNADVADVRVNAQREPINVQVCQVCQVCGGACAGACERTETMAAADCDHEEHR